VPRAIALALLLVLVSATVAGAATLGQRTLGKGDHGPDVVTLQRVLTMKGYALGVADGVFGRQTRAAVKRFQRRAGIAADGRVGAMTTSALAQPWKVRTATWYGPGLYGNRLACGGVLRRGTRGVAHRTLACGTNVAVYVNGRIAIFKVIDRGPQTAGVTLDLTSAAARMLGMTTTSQVRDASW
jgi:peptidoglycan hydrolase-like protein with peptidoglycan-binding domain